MSLMQHPSTDPQSFSSFVSLNRADRTHQPGPASRPLQRLVSWAVAAAIAVIAICMFFGTR